MNNPVVTERTKLSLLTELDFSDMMEMLMDPETSRYITHLHLRSREEYEKVLQNRIEQIRNEKGYHWVGRLKSNHELVGAVNLSLIAGTDKMQLGFQLNRKFWGMGYATELASGVLDAATRMKGFTKIFGVFDKDNLASGKVLEKLGFKPENKDIIEEANLVTYQYRFPNS